MTPFPFKREGIKTATSLAYPCPIDRAGGSLLIVLATMNPIQRCLMSLHVYCRCPALGCGILSEAKEKLGVTMLIVAMAKPYHVSLPQFPLYAMVQRYLKWVELGLQSLALGLFVMCLLFVRPPPRVTIRIAVISKGIEVLTAIMSIARVLMWPPSSHIQRQYDWSR